MYRPYAAFAVACLLLSPQEGILTPGASDQEPATSIPVPVVPDAEPAQLLINSYLSGRNLAPQQRAFLLTLLTGAAIRIDPSLARLWSQEAFQFAFTLPMTWNRVANEKNALVSLAQFDPNLAFQLFESMDATVAMPSGAVPEDLRAFAARTIFGEYWKKKGLSGLEEIRGAAQRLGASGQYPFLAMAPILRDLDRQDRLRAEALFAEALSYYGPGMRADSTDEEFCAFLNELWDVTPSPLQRQALQLAVTHLGEEPGKSDTKFYLGRNYSSRGIAEFRSRAKQLLASLLPKIREIDPNWARQIVERESGLNQAATETGTGASTDSVTIMNPSGGPVSDLATAQAIASERLKLRRIDALAGTDPNQALALAASITERALRDLALARIAARVSANDLQTAKSLIQQVGKDFNSLSVASEKLPVVVAVAKAAGVNKDQKALLEALETGFDLGEELFSEDMEIHPGKPTYDVRGFRELSELTYVGVKYAREFTLPRVRRVSRDDLRAHLLVIAAQALFEVQHPGSASDFTPI